MILWALACSYQQLEERVVASNPMHSMDRSVDRTPVTVRIEERIDAGPYLYLRTDEHPSRWLASLKKPIGVGDQVTAKMIGVAHGFHSRRADRDFESLWFAVISF